MIDVPRHDESLSALKGTTIQSEVQPDVSYALREQLGEGGMSVAFFALRHAPDAETPVVLKVMRPAIVKASGATSTLVVAKEAVALGRLNERVPPTPFVVRLIDAGGVDVRYGENAINLPWLAIEYVYGGPAGTTLDERVASSILHTSYAFDPERAAHAVECLAAGLSAIHEVNVVHRDVKPGNILCCGLGADEIFKVADFGIARPGGMAATFGDMPVGTLGHAPPEQLMLDASRVGPASDVFALATVVYFLLTGEDYFPIQVLADLVMKVRSPERRHLAEARALHPDLRERPLACAAIDAALARATSLQPDHRPQSADVFAATIVPSLRAPLSAGPPRARHFLGAFGHEPTQVSGWLWTTRHRPGGERVVRSAAWDADGRCLAATNRGLAFWEGTHWLDVPPRGLHHPDRIHFIRRMATGVWLIGGGDGSIAMYTAQGLDRVVPGPSPDTRFSHASGDIQELAVFVGSSPRSPLALHAMAAGHWVKPVLLPHAAAVTSVARLDRTRWLVSGRTKVGNGFVATYAPLSWELELVQTPQTRAYLACAGKPELGAGVAVGTEGCTVRVEREQTGHAEVEGGPNLSAVAFDVVGRAWAASMGAIWMQLDREAPWRCAWSDPAWRVPVASLFADAGLVVALTADGGILEGRG